MRIGVALTFLALSLTGFGQVTKKQLEEDFEKYKKNRELDFEAFKKKREEELKKMEQEYQDYYNEMMGLKKYYVQKKDTVKANVVDAIIKFETSISEALGKEIKVTEEVKVTDQNINQPLTKQEQAEKPTAQVVDSKAKDQSVQPAVVQQSKEDKTATQQGGKADEAKPKVTAQQTVNDASSKPKQQVAKEEPQKPAELIIDPVASAKAGIPVLKPLPKAMAYVTSKFGVRNHPVLHRPIKHNGVDMGRGVGVNIYAAADGKVVLAKFSSSFGNYIIIEHKDGYSSVYAHLSRIMVSQGDNVSKGSQIGLTGSTGRSSGAHLHYEVRLKGTPINPEDFLLEAM